MADTKNTNTIKSWQNFLIQQGATITEGLTTSFGEAPVNYPGLSATLTDLSDLGVLALEGTDSKRFLQGQSTSDTEQLNKHSVLPGAICNAKGRMLTSYHAVEPETDSLLLVMHRPLVDKTIENMGKYAAFFKTTLSNACDDYRLLGVSGADCESVLKGHFDDIPTALNQFCMTESCLLLRISPQQFLVLVKADSAEQLWQALAQSFTPIGVAYWQLQSIRAGQARVQAETAEQFVPQMLNLQATGAVNFKKGCYTGQEIVARMQYLGKLKRRTYRVILEISTPPQVATEIYDSTSNKLVGSVLMAASADEKSAEMLAVLHEDQADASSLVLNGETVAVSIAELPYSLTTS
jgi:folate-binding protein YgfZ